MKLTHNIESESFIYNEKGNLKKFRINNIKRFQHKRKNKGNKSKNIYLILLTIIIFSFILILSKKFYASKNEKKEPDNYYNFTLLNTTEEKDINEEYEDVQNYLDCLMNGTEFYKNKTYYPSENPKISIVITVYNGEPYLKTALLSIQNQDFKDIEIVMIDDCSQDNSVNLIKELMKTEPRIVLYENKENKGMLYTKSKGILLSKGKYVMTLDEDDFYTQKDAFSYLYSVAEKDNLDMLGFIFLQCGTPIIRRRPDYSDKLKIIYQPELSNFMYSLDSFGKVKVFGNSMFDLFIKSDLIKNVIKKIDEKNMNIKTNRHDDLILLFLMTRSAKSIKYVNRIFYVKYTSWKRNDKIAFRMKKKIENQDSTITCLSFLNFLEIFFKNTNNTFEDKKFAVHELNKLYFNNECKNNKDVTQRAIEICKLYLDNDYVPKEEKNKIKKFIDSNPI